MIEELFDQPLGKVTSWNNLSEAASSPLSQDSMSSKASGAIIVMQNEDPHNSDSVVNQLVTKARVLLPALMNYLYFNPSYIAVAYFGKKELPNGDKVGISQGAEDLRIKMIRFLIQEIWPPLLRTDAPDESLCAEATTSGGGGGGGDGGGGGGGAKALEEAAENPLAQERSWFLKSIENDMQVLLYLQNGCDGTKYLKVILNNSNHRLHFDVIDPREEKYRWELRMLFTRLMDNLETQRTIDSYESYEQYFRTACTFTSRHATELEQPLHPLVPVTVYGDEELQCDALLGMRPSCFADGSSNSNLDGEVNEGGDGGGDDDECESLASGAGDTSLTGMDTVLADLNRSASLDISAIYPPRIDFKREVDGGANERYYLWMESLQKPESTTLDYKSYFSCTAAEIRHRSVKFMCGFLNAYREGKLIIGVHELARRDDSGNPIKEKEGKNTIVLHNDLIDQYVVGVRISTEELEEVQSDISSQLLNCIPPIPPECVRIDVVPIKFPEGLAYSQTVLVIYEESAARTNVLSREALRQKSNFAIRFLHALGLSIIPFGEQDDELRDLIALADPAMAEARLKAEAFVVAAVSDPDCLTTSDWEAALEKALVAPKSRCRHALVRFPEERLGPLRVPPLHIVEVSVNIDRCGFKPLLDYKGKFFSGWPSIPIWDVTTKTIRRVERNCNLFVSTTDAGGDAAGADANTSLADYFSPFGSARLTARAAAQRPQRSLWFNNAQVAPLVLSFIYDPVDVKSILQFRLIHPVCNRVFETRQGTHLVQMLFSEPVGGLKFNTSSIQISRIQYAFLQSFVAPLPLLLCRVYEILGSLPSPYPYVFVPIMQQSFRVSPFLVPVFYHQHYFDGQMRIAVVLDLRDGILKTIELRDGNLVLQAIVGMTFSPMNKKQVKRVLDMQQGHPALFLPRQMLRHLTNVHSAGGAGGGGPFQSNFLARRTLQPKALRQQSGRMSSSIMSPMMSENTRSAPRAVEANIPVLHFCFLTKSAVAAPYRARDSWTLQHLLSWFNAVFTDTAHVRPFGYCERSIAFYIDNLSCVCEQEVESNAVEMVKKHVKFADPKECFLHKKKREWMKI